MTKWLLLVVATGVATGLLVGGVRLFGADSAPFAFLVVWVPMTWLGTISRVVPPRLPAWFYELRAFESDPWLYERLGVRVAKLLLRRGPLAAFNPGLHLPADRSAEGQLRLLERRMEVAEASHTILLVVTFGVAVHAAVRGWWVAAALTLAFNVVMNGYPAMLQRYNRVLLRARYPA